ncbi:MAG: LexA family protein [Thermonemataceae bacterium]
MHKLPIYQPLPILSAGFPSPAEDFEQMALSLDQAYIKNKEATFFARVAGDSMVEAGIEEGDLLIIDRSITPTSGKIVVGYLDGAFTVKRLIQRNGKVYLQPENKRYTTIDVSQVQDFRIWGVVTTVIKQV